jgi:hypothetical protein
MACSKCRYRFTGPKWFYGIAQRANSLMMELVFSGRKEAQLNLAADEAEDKGAPVANLRAQAQREREMREKLWDEWIAERMTLAQCEKRIGERGKAATSDLFPMRPDFAEDALRVRLEEVHELKLAHDLVKMMRDAPEAIQSVPFGTKEFRDAALLQILAQNDMSELFYRVPPSLAESVKDMAIDNILEVVGEPGQLQRLIDGSISIGEFPPLSGLRDAVSAVGQASSSTPSKEKIET